MKSLKIKEILLVVGSLYAMTLLLVVYKSYVSFNSAYRDVVQRYEKEVQRYEKEKAERIEQVAKQKEDKKAERMAKGERKKAERIAKDEQIAKQEKDMLESLRLYREAMELQEEAKQVEAERTAPTEPPMPEFRKLEFEEEVEAQKLWEWVVTQRSMGRLPVMTYGEMVRKCRDIKQRWPGTKYAYLATRALADLPEKYQQMYNIKPQEIDLKNF